jgi:hypothetical protein
MTKPVVTLRNTKGSALTYTELDTNFSNLRDATITVSDGTNTKAIDLNGTIEFTAAGTVTIGVNPSTGVVTITGTGSGTVNSGAAGALAYYPSSGSTVDDTRLSYSYDSGGQVVTVDSGTDALKLSGSALQLDAGGTSGNPQNVGILFGGIVASAPSSVSVTPGENHLAFGPSASYNNNDTVGFANFAGLISIYNQNTRNVALWLCGGGTATKLGDSVSDTSGTLVYYNLYAGWGYQWTNNTGSTANFNFGAIKLGAIA